MHIIAFHIEATKISPYELMFGRKPKLPIDATFEKAREDSTRKPTQEYINDLKERTEKTRKIVESHIDKAKSKQKKYYDRKAKAAQISKGDKVLVKKLAFEGKHKIQDKFEEGEYLVIDQPRPDIPVFKVKSTKDDREKTLHRNHLILVHSQDTEEEDNGDKVTEDTVEIVKDPSEEKLRDENKESDVARLEESESDEEYEFIPSISRCGDAHNPNTGGQSEESVTETGFKEVAVDTVMEEGDGTYGNDESVLHSHQDEGLVEEGQGVQGYQAEEQSDTEHTDSQMLEPEPSKEEEIEVTQKNDNTETKIIHQTEETDNTTEVKDIEKAPTMKTPTVPRRPTRERKLPKHFEDFHMYRMVARPVDTKLQALDALMKSGALTEMDSDTAHKLIVSLMK
ncbi:uncharacterized protein LOC123561773 [Mercenaria mercenaria]|uniref:uncharacterized protein LOC123561773 n=1 Tax=Mercenaria mercenaria TaxID=6596 RepID=UPI00234F9446|nr:uncharacterized protein LOC123561773 [Mercenaria mercenaria]